MYTPKHYLMPNAEYAKFIEQFPLATLISIHELETSQCPLVYLEQNNQLVGHLSIANPQLVAFKKTAKVKAVFTGHDGYISASWYPSADQVPTWNYSALEVTGNIRLATTEETQAILIKQIRVLESRVNESWTLDKLPEVKRQAMLKAICGFVIDIDSWQGKQKLSQNKSDDVKKHLTEAASNRSGTDYSHLIS